MWLHFVGRQIYGISRLRREARKYGVQRAIPLVKYHDLDFGSKILLAIHKKDRDGQEYAIIFGYFIVESVSFANLPEELENQLINRLDVVEYMEGGWVEDRYCGSYTVGGMYVVNNSLHDIIDKVKDITEGKVKPKMFLKGKFHEFKNYVAIPCKFTRGLKWVNVDKYDLQFLDEPTEERRIYILRDYKKRDYLTKRDLVRLEVKPLTEYMRW